MPRTVITALGGVALAYLGLCALLFATQRSMIYYPQPRAGAITTRITALRIQGGSVLVTVKPRVGPRAVLYFGGNAEDVSGSVDGLAEGFPDHALYLLHYRGYGGSAGRASEAALFADAVALFDLAHREHPEVQAIGRSLGSGVAVHLASVRPIARLVLVTPYDSLQGLAEAQFPWVPVRWLLRDRFESWRYAPQVAAPTQLIVAEHDTVVPRASSEALLGRFQPGTASLRERPRVGVGASGLHGTAARRALTAAGSQSRG